MSSRALHSARASARWLVAVALALLPVTGRAQVGAIGAAPASLSGTDEATAGAPILIESGFMLGKGQWGVTAFAAVTTGSFALGSGFDDVDFTYQQVLLGGFYQATERLMVGVLAAPYLGYTASSGGIDIDDSGRGDVGLYAKAQLWRSAPGNTHLAAFGTLALPAGEEDWGRAGLGLNAGLALSHRLERVTLHGSGSINLPFDDEDGESALGLAAGGVYAASPTLGVSLELMAATSDGESMVDIAPGARVRLGSSVFLSGALLANVSTSYDIKPYDAAFVLGLNIVR